MTSTVLATFHALLNNERNKTKKNNNKQQQMMHKVLTSLQTQNINGVRLRSTTRAQC